MRGIDDVEDAHVGPGASARSKASTPSSASATTSMSGWRSSSSRRPPRTIPWSSAIRMRVIALMVSSIGRALAGRGADASWPPTSSARSRMPDRPRPPSAGAAAGRVEAAAVVGDPQHGAPDERQLDVDAARRPRAGRCWTGLLGDAVDHELLLVGERRERPVARERRADAGPLARSPRPAWRSAATRPWSSSAVGRSWRASRSSSSIAWLASPLVSAARRAAPAGASRDVASSRSRIAVSAWLTSSWRSWASGGAPAPGRAGRRCRPARRSSSSRRASR